MWFPGFKVCVQIQNSTCTNFCVVPHTRLYRYAPGVPVVEDASELVSRLSAAEASALVTRFNAVGPLYKLHPVRPIALESAR
jgi:hypothetical protein